MRAPAPPSTMDRLPRDGRGLPVPHVAGWTSEQWGVARADTRIRGWPMALFCTGRPGRGLPMFDVVNEERQRGAVVAARCQVCNMLLPMTDGPTTGRHQPYGWLPERIITDAYSFDDDGHVVTHEPLLCRPCCEWVTIGCCRLGREPAGIVRVDRYDMILQYVDPSRAPVSKAARYGDNPEARERLGKIARRHGGLVGYIKLALTETTKE